MHRGLDYSDRGAGSGSKAGRFPYAVAKIFALLRIAPSSLDSPPETPTARVLDELAQTILSRQPDVKYHMSSFSKISGKGTSFIVPPTNRIPPAINYIEKDVIDLRRPAPILTIFTTSPHIAFANAPVVAGRPIR